jgi:hypothetical protein
MTARQEGKTAARFTAPTTFYVVEMWDVGEVIRAGANQRSLA